MPAKVQFSWMCLIPHQTQRLVSLSVLHFDFFTISNSFRVCVFPPHRYRWQGEQVIGKCKHDFPFAQHMYTPLIHSPSPQHAISPSHHLTITICHHAISPSSLPSHQSQYTNILCRELSKKMLSMTRFWSGSHSTTTLSQQLPVSRSKSIYLSSDISICTV